MRDVALDKFMQKDKSMQKRIVYMGRRINRRTGKAFSIGMHNVCANIQNAEEFPEEWIKCYIH